MGNNREANQILSIIMIVLLGLLILRFASCSYNIATMPDVATEGQPSAPVSVETKPDEPVFHPGAYYPDAQKESSGGFLAEVDPLVLALVGGVATFGAVGAIAFVMFGMGGSSQDPAVEGDAAQKPKKRQAPPTSEPPDAYDPYAYPDDFDPGGGGVNIAKTLMVVAAAGFALILIIVGPMRLAFWFGMMFE